MAIESKVVVGFAIENTLFEFASPVTALRELKDGEEIGRDTFSLNLEGKKHKVDLGDDNWKPLSPNFLGMFYRF